MLDVIIPPTFPPEPKTRRYAFVRWLAQRLGCAAVVSSVEQQQAINALQVAALTLERQQRELEHGRAALRQAMNHLQNVRP